MISIAHPIPSAYATRSRTREIGIRLALGATRARLVQSVVASAGGVLFAGVIVGLAAAALATRAMSEVLLEAVDRLLGKEWIDEVPTPPDSGGPPRRYYALTPAGRAELTAELERMDAVVRFARGRKLLKDV